MQDLEKFKNEMNLSGKNVYVGNRYAPVYLGDWDKTKEYEPLSIVIYQGDSFVSRGWVAKDVDIHNEDYWHSIGVYNAQVAAYKQRVEEYIEKSETIESNVDTKLKEVTDYIDDVKEKIMINLSDFGVVGDGITDDSDAFINAVTYGETKQGNVKLIIPTGTYVITKPVTIHTDNFSVEGNNATILWQGTADLGDENGRNMTRGIFEFVGEELTARNDILSATSTDKFVTLEVGNTGDYQIGEVVSFYIDYGAWDTAFNDYKPSIATLARVISKTNSSLTIDYVTPFKINGSNFTGRVYKIKTLKNPQIKDLNIIDETLAFPEDATFTDRNTWVSGVLFNKVENLHVENIRVKGHKAKGVRITHAIDGTVQNIWTEYPKAYGGGAGYGMQIANSQRINVYNFKGLYNRHLIDFSKAYHCNVYDSGDMYARYGTFDCHGFSEHDITFNNCYGSYVFGNGIQQFPCVTENITIDGGIVDHISTQFVKDLTVSNARINTIRNIDRINNLLLSNVRMEIKSSGTQFKSGKRGYFESSFAKLENSHVKYDVTANAQGFGFRDFDEVSVNDNQLISEKDMFGQVGSENVTRMIFENNHCKNVLLRLSTSTMKQVTMSKNRFLSTVSETIAEGTQFLDIFGAITSDKYFVIYMFDNVMETTNPTRWIRFNAPITGENLLWLSNNNVLVGDISEFFNGATLTDGFLFHREGKKDINLSTLSSSKILNI